MLADFDSGKRYYTFGAYCKKRFGGKIAKLPIDAGFTCPNRDGSKGIGGCTYCSGRGSGDFASSSAMSIKKQIDAQKLLLTLKWNPIGYIAYFQAYTNTYAPLPYLREKYEAALSCDGVVGLSIATRADCLSEEIAAYLAEIKQRAWIMVELGLQSIHDQTAERINRQHSYADFKQSLFLLAKHQIPVCVHLINGLPGETSEMMLKTALAIGQLPVDAVKIHSLHILKDTQMAKEYLRGEFVLQSREEYIDTVCNQLEVLPANIMVERLTGDGNRADLIAPDWSRDKRRVLNGINHELKRRNTCQGFYAVK